MSTDPAALAAVRAKLYPTMRLRWVKRPVVRDGITDTLLAGHFTHAVLQQWWASDWKDAGEWRDVETETVA